MHHEQQSGTEYDKVYPKGRYRAVASSTVEPDNTLQQHRKRRDYSECRDGEPRIQFKIVHASFLFRSCSQRTRLIISAAVTSFPLAVFSSNARWYAAMKFFSEMYTDGISTDPRINPLCHSPAQPRWGIVPIGPLMLRNHNRFEVVMLRKFPDITVTGRHSISPVIHVLLSLLLLRTHLG